MSKTFKNGLPTDIDIRALFDAFGLPAEGSVIPYADVTAIIKTPSHSARWLTVTARWRKHLEREHGIYTLARDGVFTVMTPSMQLEHGVKKQTKGVRQIRGSIRVLGGIATERLTDVERKRLTHTQQNNATALFSMQQGVRRSPVSLPQARA